MNRRKEKIKRREGEKTKKQKRTPPTKKEKNTQEERIVSATFGIGKLDKHTENNKIISLCCNPWELNKDLWNF